MRTAMSLGEMYDRISTGPQLLAKFHEFWPGLLLTAMIAAAASFVASTYGGPVMLLALLMGMALNFLSESPRALPGIRFTAKRMLRLGVALLGLRIAASDVMGLGFEVLELVIAGVAVTILGGILAARLLGSGRQMGVLVGGATAICGASAALAIGSVMPQGKENERDIVFTVVTVTALSTVAMVVYPALFTVLGFDDRVIGILIGATIHDVAQVVGAGYAVSEVAGDTATIVKLFRVALLLPIVFILSLAFSAMGRGQRRSGPIPGFAVAFAALVLLNSAGLVPAAIQNPLSDLSRGCLVAAVAAIGLTTSLRDIANVGYRPIALAVSTTVLLLTFSTTAMFWAG